MARRMKTIMGVTAPAPRITPRALWLVARHLAIPLLSGLVLFDIVVWWLVEQIWGVCIGLWCWF